MTSVHVRERVPSTEMTAVRVVDSDVHPVARPGVIMDYIPEPMRSKYFKPRKVGSTMVYDAPDFAHAFAMRVDAFTKDGGFPGSDPDLAFEQLIMGAGSDIGILEPGFALSRIPEASQAMAIAYNHWLDENWLDGHNNWHQRWRGSICAAIDDPHGAARVIEDWAEHPNMVQVLIRAEPRPAWGDPKYDPVWAAAVKHNLPVTCHLSRGSFDLMPMPPVGFLSYNHDHMVGYSLLAVNQILSLIFDGTFDRFPDLRIVLVEHGFTWILPLMWRMDALYEARKGWLDIKRKPSEYVKEHIKFTSQPLDYPEDKTELTRALEWMEADKILMFSSDYPHWTFDDPRWLIKHLPPRMRDNVMFRNAIETYHLPDTVPVLEGQVKVH